MSAIMHDGIPFGREPEASVSLEPVPGRRPSGRRGFTLVELMVAMALIIFIMVVLSESFSAAMNTFRVLKAMGDMGERLRGAATVMRRDLAADHFDGRKRVSDLSSQLPTRPREGFFTYDPGGVAPEGNDPHGNPSYRNIGGVLHFAIKLRGNERQNFVSASVPPGSPLLGTTTFFHAPQVANDARFMTFLDEYRSAWAEVRYFLYRITDQNGNPASAPQGSATGTPLYALYRSQMVVVPDNREINSWQGTPAITGKVGADQLPQYSEFSCWANNDGTLYFNNPTDLLIPAYRAFGKRGGFSPTNARYHGATMLLADVVSFDIEVLKLLRPSERANQNWDWTRDTWTVEQDPGNLNVTVSQSWSLRAIKITLRVWDVKTNQSRQITLIQDL